MTDARAQSAADAAKYISELLAAYPSIRELWLFGSRANGYAKPESDWDFLAFADEVTLTALRGDLRFHRPGIGLMIVTDGNQFETPWMEGSRVDHGELAKGWRWKRRSATMATYLAAKGDFRPTERRALLMYPQENKDAG